MPTLPLHPIIVHFPIALGLITPVLLLFIWIGIHKWSWPIKTWGLVILMYLIVFLSSLAALKTGEIDEDKVESYVTHEALEEHEELGEKMPWMFAGLLFFSALPLVFQKRKKILMTTAFILSIGSIVPIAVTGHTGGKLVYEYGAANAHIRTQPDLELEK